MNVLELFAGIGGIGLGLERSGMTVVGQVEIDPFCRRVLAKHWPEVPRHDDVRTCVEWWRSEPRPAVHVVAGGFPCQPVSLAGRGLAQADERWLWPAMWTVIRDLRPQYAILENVPGLLGRGMGDVLGDLAAIGYDAEWDCIPAAAVGAPHRRDRVFVVAYPDGEHGWVQPEPQSGSGSTADTGLDGQTQSVADTESVGRGTRRPGRPAGDGPDRFGLASSGLADPNGIRRNGRRSSLVGDAAHPNDGRSRARWPAPAADPWWSPEPDVGRVAHGIPGRVDRLRALGNAVVPQVAQHIGELVMAGGVDHGPK